MRTNVSDFLRRNLGAKNMDERKELMRKAHAYDREVRERHDEMQEVEVRAKAGTALHASGCPSFGPAPSHQRANQPTLLPAVPFDGGG